MCLIGRVLTNKTFNAFGMLETMRKVMNPPRGLTAKEIGKNLFSFQFKSVTDMQGILCREPWHFDKNVILLKELLSGEQPSTVEFNTVTFWVHLYDLPMSARTPNSIKQIGGSIGDMVEIDPASLEGVSRSIRIKEMSMNKSRREVGGDEQSNTRKVPTEGVEEVRACLEKVSVKGQPKVCGATSMAGRKE
ncbi:hypothetical protein ACS0TY_021295 [Phlomoides rotata]